MRAVDVPLGVLGLRLARALGEALEDLADLLALEAQVVLGPVDLLELGPVLLELVLLGLQLLQLLGLDPGVSAYLSCSSSEGGLGGSSASLRRLYMGRLLNSRPISESMSSSEPSSMTRRRKGLSSAASLAGIW